MQPENNVTPISPHREVKPPPLTGRPTDQRYGLWRGEAGSPQGGDQEATLPLGIILVPPMLQRASAAAPEILTGGIDPRRAGLVNTNATGKPSLATGAQRTGRHQFPGQGERHVERCFIRKTPDAVTFGADAIDTHLAGWRRSFHT